jgi:hypothetical protein
MELEASINRQNLAPLGDTRFDQGGERPVLSRMEHSVRERGNCVGAWLNLVERAVRDRKVAGSNPVAQTNRSWSIPATLARELA